MFACQPVVTNDILCHVTYHHHFAPSDAECVSSQQPVTYNKPHNNNNVSNPTREGNDTTYMYSQI